MYKIDITKNYLELFIGKRDIEDMLFERNEITEEFSIEDFIKYLNFGTHIYWVDENNVYPFKIINTKDNTYLFYISTTGKEPKDLFNALESIKYDFNNLKHKTKYEIATENVVYKPHFIINDELYYN